MALPYPEATVFHSHARKLSSAVVRQDYRISVGLPPSYDGSNTAYPVLYVLDENTSFGLASNAAVVLMFGQEMPEVLIVGIGYDIASYEDWVATGTKITPRPLPTIRPPQAEQPPFFPL